MPVVGDCCVYCSWRSVEMKKNESSITDQGCECPLVQLFNSFLEVWLTGSLICLGSSDE